eukprot:10569732-Lingulodinium_polyedra.AAC.1
MAVQQWSTDGTAIMAGSSPPSGPCSTVAGHWSSQGGMPRQQRRDYRPRSPPLLAGSPRRSLGG